MNIMEIAEQKNELLRKNLFLVCSNCSQRYHSIFDRFFILASDGICYDCAPANDETELLANNCLNIAASVS